MMSLRPDFLAAHQAASTVQLLVNSGLATRSDALLMLSHVEHRVTLSPCMRHARAIGVVRHGPMRNPEESRRARQAVFQAIRGLPPCRLHPKHLKARAREAAKGRLAQTALHDLVQAEITRRLFLERRAVARMLPTATHS